jgi:hypothetical protein
MFNFGGHSGHHPPQAAQPPPDALIKPTPEAFPLSNRHSDRVPNIPRLAPYISSGAGVSFDNLLKGMFDENDRCARGPRHDKAPFWSDREACWDDQEADRDVFLCDIRDHVILRHAFV